MSVEKLHVAKLVATGNDFLFIDGRATLPGAFGKVERAEIARRLCDRHFGIGADGMVFVENLENAFRWDFYNTDGSFAEMCGNATRCMGRWFKNHLNLSSARFETAAGTVGVSVTESVVTSHLDYVKATLKPVDVEINGRTVPVTFVNTGVPHAVIKIDDLEDAASNREAIGILRFHSAAGTRGANVTFLQVTGKGQLKTKSFERGVEGFTLSCGTGVLAAAAVCLQEQGGLAAEVSTPGGDLKVQYGVGFQGVSLTGPAVEVFQTDIGEEILK